MSVGCLTREIVLDSGGVVELGDNSEEPADEECGDEMDVVVAMLGGDAMLSGSLKLLSCNLPSAESGAATLRNGLATLTDSGAVETLGSGWRRVCRSIISEVEERTESSAASLPPPPLLLNNGTLMLMLSVEELQSASLPPRRKTLPLFTVPRPIGAKVVGLTDNEPTESRLKLLPEMVVVVVAGSGANPQAEAMLTTSSSTAASTPQLVIISLLKFDKDPLLLDPAPKEEEGVTSSLTQTFSPLMRVI